MQFVSNVKTALCIQMISNMEVIAYVFFSIVKHTNQRLKERQLEEKHNNKFYYRSLVSVVVAFNVAALFAVLDVHVGDGCCPCRR